MEPDYSAKLAAAGINRSFGQVSGAGSIGCAESQQPALNRAIEEMGLAHKGALEILESLSSFVERIDGGIKPGEAGNATREAFGPGLVGDLRNRIGDTRTVLRAIRDLTVRLNSIA